MKILTPGLLKQHTQAKAKDKAACLGLFSYPVLMAADILLYKYAHIAQLLHHLTYLHSGERTCLLVRTIYSI